MFVYKWNALILLIENNHSIFFCVFVLESKIGMHRKSLEAAETLKDDSGGSDRDDEHSKASDTSSTGNPSTKSTPNSKSKKLRASEAHTSPLTPATSNSDGVNHNSVTPTSTSSVSTSQVASSPSTTPSTSTQHTPLPVHHLIESKSMLASPTHPNFHHDNDTEAFRWVGDPISFIRCDTFNFQFIFLSLSRSFNLSVVEFGIKSFNSTN